MHALMADMAEKTGHFAEYVSEQGLAKEFDCTTRTLRRWRRLGIGPRHLKMGPRRIVYRVDDVKAWINAGGGKR